MKSLYLGALMTSLTLGSFAQQQLQKERDNCLKKAPSIAQEQPKAVIWSETFDVTGAVAPNPTAGPTFTTSNGDWTASGVNANIWKHSFLGTAGQYYGGLEPSFTTEANGFMIFDSDSANPGASSTAFVGELISPVIDLTAHSSVLLNFEQEFSFCCEGSLDINLAVSTDGGTTWSDSINLSSGLTANTRYSTVTGGYNKAVNLSTLAGGNSSVKLKFTWNGASNNSAYFWAIDDITLSTGVDNEIVGSDQYFGSQAWTYYQVPIAQIQPIDFTAMAENLGDLTQTNVTLNVDVNSGAFTTTSPAGVSFVTNEKDTLKATTQYTPAAALGTHTITWNISQTENDTTSNVLPADSFAVVNNIYARDNGVSTGAYYNQGKAYEVGAMYDLVAAADLYAVNAFISSYTQTGTEVFAKVYEVDFSTSPATYTQLSQTPYFTIANSDKGTMKVFAFSGAVSLQANKTYLVAICTDGDNGATNNLVYLRAQKSTGGAMFLNLDATSPRWTTLPNVPVVRMNFDVTAGVEENTLEGVSIYPNPTSGVVNISNDNFTNNTIEVRDLAGRVVLSTSASTKTTIDLTGNTAGVYIVKVYNENGQKIEKVTLK